MKTILFLILLTLSPTSAHFDDWECGVNEVTKRISYALAYLSSDKDRTNQCCKTHDRDYEDYLRYGYPTIDEANKKFDLCLRGSQSLFTRFIVRPAFNVCVAIYTMWNKLFG